ncbi:hypothetical protein CYY_007286 [Polysphondylium violaceum]|uniref:Uncharacterized protein n=1 Tax=Polysphondylium violaceum TaxID=133409 RepID=A0A8J4PQN3_9MYCE|nr:hypothetical protein CYY_007286 [Polysphondylium violaceum]
MPMVNGNQMSLLALNKVIGKQAWWWLNTNLSPHSPSVPHQQNLAKFTPSLQGNHISISFIVHWYHCFRNGWIHQCEFDSTTGDIQSITNNSSNV